MNRKTDYTLYPKQVYIVSSAWHQLGGVAKQEAGWRTLTLTARARYLSGFGKNTIV